MLILFSKSSLRIFQPIRSSFLFKRIFAVPHLEKHNPKEIYPNKICNKMFGSALLGLFKRDFVQQFVTRTKQ